MKHCPKCSMPQNDEVEICDCGHEFTIMKTGYRLSPETTTTIMLLFFELSVLGVIAIFTVGNIITNIVETDSDAAAIYIAMFSIPFFIANMINLSYKILFIVTSILSFIAINILYVWNLVMFITYNNDGGAAVVGPIVITNLAFAGLIIYFCCRVKKHL